MSGEVHDPPEYDAAILSADEWQRWYYAALKAAREGDPTQPYSDRLFLSDAALRAEIVEVRSRLAEEKARNYAAEFAWGERWQRESERSEAAEARVATLEAALRLVERTRFGGEKRIARAALTEGSG